MSLRDGIDVRLSGGIRRVQSERGLVARYDTCHGWPHLDVVNGKGELVLKRWMEGMDTGEAFRWAVLDFEENHEKYN